MGKPSNDCSVEMTRQKFTTSCYKLIAYSVLFFGACFAILADDAAVRLSTGEGWIHRGTISNYHDWPALRLRNIPVLDSGTLLNKIYILHLSILRYIKKVYLIQYILLILIEYWCSSNIDVMLDTSPVVWLYLVVLTHYIYSSILLIFNLEGPKQKDKYQMLLHHFVTTGLVLYSWYWKLARVGAIILILHDMSDPLMEVAKLMLYMGKQLWANIWFGMFALSFVVGRCVIFPLTILIPTM
jgi:hypothetical protein